MSFNVAVIDKATGNRLLTQHAMCRKQAEVVAKNLKMDYPNNTHEVRILKAGKVTWPKNYVE